MTPTSTEFHRAGYLLRHSDGTVRIWEHTRTSDEVLASSVRAFLDSLKPEGS